MERNITFLRHHISLFIASLVVLLCFYLIWPAFHAVHLEGYTAQVQSIALLKSLAPGLEHDPSLPLVSQFIYQTRSAVIDILTIIYRIFPESGDMAFRGMVVVSFALLLISSMIFAKRWGGISPIFAFFALVLTPGIPETAFFFNDNIVSAAFASMAIAIISGKSRKSEWLLAGVFLGLAILSRVDAVFMLPMIIGIVFFAYKQIRERLVASGLICMAVLFVLTASAVVHGFSLIDAFATARKFVINLSEKNNWFWVRIFFFGLGALPFLLIGVWLNFSRMNIKKEYIGILVFIGYPLLLALLAPKATEVRYIFPLLAPVVALHAGTGLNWIYRQFLYEKGEALRNAVGVVAFAVLVMVFPPSFLKVHDGPRAMFGRLWSPILWSRWQAAVDETMARTQKLAAALDDGQSNILISTHYNDEFYSRLRLMEAGFLPAPTSGSYPGCYGFSLFKKGDSTVFHVRTDPQYRIAPINMTYNAALQISAAFSCEMAQSYHQVYITTFGVNEYGISPKVYGISSFSFDGPLDVKFDDLRENLSPNNPHLRRNYGILDFKSMTVAEILETKTKAENYLLTHPERDPETGKVIGIEDYEKYYYPSSGPTVEWLLTIRTKIGLTESTENLPGNHHEK
jgi:hypothetical protein